MSGVVSVRMFNDADFDSAWPLFHRLSLDWALGTLPTEEQTRDHVRLNILGDASDVRIALAFRDEEAIGLATFAILYPVPNRKAQLFLKELFVDANARGIGIGRKLMRFVARYAFEHGCSRLDWAVDTTNGAAIEFYAALGAKPLNEKLYFRLANDELEDFAAQQES
jgi:GNAT superfamily N-acetyltransferase